MLKVIISSMIGNTMEWIEYTLYAQFVNIISKQFFPPSEFSDFLTWLIFAFGFIVRPLGGLFFGRIGDRHGRRSALSYSMIVMTISTAGIGFLPTYQTIGILAPILLTLFRIMQGFSLGGEFSACICYVVEHSNTKYRGVLGSISFIGMTLGILLGSLIARYMFKNIEYQELLDYKWRIPFIMCIFLGMVGYYIRTKVKESPVYQEIKKNNELSISPLKEVLSKNLKQIILSMGIYVNVTSCFYTLTIYLQSMMQKKSIGFSAEEAGIISMTGISILSIMIPLSGYISDLIGRRALLIFGNLFLIIYVVYIFDLILSGNFYSSMSGVIIFAALVGIYLGPVPTTLVEIFPANVRSTGIGVSYNISAAVFGGTVPVIASALFLKTQNLGSIAYYLIFTGVISLGIVLFLFEETYKKDLQ